MGKESEIRETIRELIIDISMPEQLVKLIDDVLEPAGIYCGLKVSARDKKDRHTYLLGAYYTLGVDKDFGYIKLFDEDSGDDESAQYVQKTEIGIPFEDIEEVAGFIEKENDNEFTCIRILTEVLVFEIMVDI